MMKINFNFSFCVIFQFNGSLLVRFEFMTYFGFFFFFWLNTITIWSLSALNFSSIFSCFFPLKCCHQGHFSFPLYYCCCHFLYHTLSHQILPCAISSCLFSLCLALMSLLCPIYSISQLHVLFATLLVLLNNIKHTIRIF